MEQTFSQASAFGDAFPRAFSVALDAYVDSGHILTIQEAITKILSGRRLPMGDVNRRGDQRLLNQETAEKVATLLKENRLRELTLAHSMEVY